MDIDALGHIVVKKNELTGRAEQRRRPHLVTVRQRHVHDLAFAFSRDLRFFI